MNNKNKVEISLLISNKAGVLSSLMVKGGSLGLIYIRQHTEKLNADNSRIVISFDGELNCNKHESITTFEAHPAVIKVERITINDADNTVVNRSASVTEHTDNPLVAEIIEAEEANEKTAIDEPEVNRSAMNHFL